MIINIDHIAYSSLDIKRDIEVFKTNKYSLRFYETLPNLNIKKKFLSKYDKMHQLALLINDKGFNIELLNHGETTNNEGYIKLIDAENVIVQTDNIDSSVKFWSYFGFKIERDNRMAFSSLFIKDRKYVIKLEKCEKTPRKLNDVGFNCMAFISTDIEKDCKKLSNLGCAVTEIQELIVNNMPMLIAFAQRDNNEIVEIIQIHTRN